MNNCWLLFKEGLYCNCSKDSNHSLYRMCLLSLMYLKEGNIMFAGTFWVLAVWFIVNVIWMWFALDNQSLQKTFAWINVVAVVIGFWVYFTGTSGTGISTWFNVLNYVNIVLACVQFYYGYRKLHNTDAQHWWNWIEITGYLLNDWLSNWPVIFYRR